MLVYVNGAKADALDVSLFISQNAPSSLLIKISRNGVRNENLNLNLNLN